MTVYDLIFMACLSLLQGSECKQEMLKCVTEKRDNQLQIYLKATDLKKQTPEQFLTTQPQQDWQGWVLDCAEKQALHLPHLPYK